MFLVVFVTLAISIIGLFAQVVGIQTARLNAQQTALAQTMLVWHGTAVNLVHAAAPTNIGGMTGCRMTLNVNTAMGGTPPVCAVGMTSLLVATAEPNGWPTLPSNYQTTPYSFYSVVFQAAALPSTKYVLTYAYDADASGLLKLPDSSGTAVGATRGVLMGQMKRLARKQDIVYGSVFLQGGLKYLTMATSNTGAVTGLPAASYVVPSFVPTDAVALLSIAD